MVRTPKRNRVRITVRWRKEHRRWVVSVGALEASRHLFKFRAVAHAVSRARELVADDEVCQVVMFLRNGRIDEERTYPRSSDPKERRG